MKSPIAIKGHSQQFQKQSGILSTQMYKYKSTIYIQEYGLKNAILEEVNNIKLYL